MCLGTKCFIFDIIPIVLLIFEDIKFICFQNGLLSIRTPRYFRYSLLSGEIKNSHAIKHCDIYITIELFLISVNYNVVGSLCT